MVGIRENAQKGWKHGGIVRDEIGRGSERRVQSLSRRQSKSLIQDEALAVIQRKREPEVSDRVFQEEKNDTQADAERKR
jgi:hypothetical protein